MPGPGYPIPYPTDPSPYVVCDGFFVGQLEDARKITIDLQQAGDGQATVDVTLNGARALHGFADCQDNGYGETDVFMVFNNNSEAEASISFEGEIFGDGLFGQRFKAYLADEDDYEERPPVPALPRFTYWKSAWDEGIKADEATLEGAWQLVGVATTKRCGYFAKDAYAERGLRNADGSQWSLEFGTYGDSAFSVMLHNLGNDQYDQGPFVVRKTEPQFSRWAYAGGRAQGSSRFEHACRLDPYDDYRLICMTPLKVTDASQVGSEVRDCAGDTFGIVQVFDKVILGD